MATGHHHDTPRYLLEWYRPGPDEESLQQTALRLAAAARALSAEGGQVELLLTLYVPGDEVAFCLFAAASADTVGQVSRRAWLPEHRITEAIQVDPTTRDLRHHVPDRKETT